MTENKDKFHASCFQERLQKLIEAKTKANNKFSQKQLSAETGIAEGSISKYLRGRATNTGVGIAQFIKLRDERIIID